LAVGGAGNTTGTSKRKPFSIIFVGPLVPSKRRQATMVPVIAPQVFEIKPRISVLLLVENPG